MRSFKPTWVKVEEKGLTLKFAAMIKGRGNLLHALTASRTSKEFMKQYYVLMANHTPQPFGHFLGSSV